MATDYFKHHYDNMTSNADLEEEQQPETEQGKTWIQVELERAEMGLSEYDKHRRRARLGVKTGLIPTKYRHLYD